MAFAATLQASLTVRSRQYNTSHGLSHNTVRGFLQDRKGFIWMPTLDGLSRFDGYGFRNYLPDPTDSLTLADNRIQSVQEDANGFLWIITGAQKTSCYNPRTGNYEDFTGTGDAGALHSKLFIDSRNEVWLWHADTGCRRVNYSPEKGFSSVLYSFERGTLPHNQVRFVHEDGSGTIWVGTKQGLVRFGEERQPEPVCNDINFFQAISNESSVFFLTYDNRLLSYDTLKQELSPLLHFAPEGAGHKPTGAFFHNDRLYLLTSLGVRRYDALHNTLHTDRELFGETLLNGETTTDNVGNIWIYNNTGRIWQLLPEENRCKRFDLIPPRKTRYIDYERYHIVNDTRGIIWISTYGNGLFAYDTAKQALHHYTSEDADALIPSDYLLSLTIDRAGTVWVGSEFTGIAQLTVLNDNNTRYFPENPQLYNRGNSVRLLSSDKEEGFVVGTRLGGLYRYDSTYHRGNSQKDAGTNIYARIVSSDGKEWLGSRGEGVCVDGEWYRKSASDTLSLSHNHIFAIEEDRKGRIWIGTFGGGINLAVNENGKYTFRNFLSAGFNQSRIRTLLQLRNGYMLAGTSEGIYYFHSDSLLADSNNYRYYSKFNSTLPASEIRCLYEDSNERIWLGSAGNGLIAFTPEKNGTAPLFKNYTTTDGLANNIVQSVREDNDGNIWVATEFGISKLYPGKMIFENYFFSNNSIENVYSENCSLAAANGDLIFGTNHGFLVIDPNKTRPEVPKQQLILTDLLINGVSVENNKEPFQLASTIAYTDKLQLKHTQNTLTFFFSATNYSESGLTKYACYLENYDKNRLGPSEVNTISYKDLPPGTYHFRVRACNSAGIWGEEKSLLTVVIEPPFWATTTAWILYLLGSTLLIGGIARILLNSRRLKHRIRLEKELTDYKLRFFTNISHEFRTPLTLIRGNLERLGRISDLPQEATSSIHSLELSSNRMLRLIDQLLEFRKMQHNKLHLGVEATQLRPFLLQIFHSFEENAADREINYRFNAEGITDEVWIDREKVDKICYNLLSNAFKYTPRGGEISLHIGLRDKETWVLEVWDSGIGIAPEKQKELFSRFMQTNYSGESFGIGLHLTYELVQIHKGSIRYTARPEGGSIFRVELPATRSTYLENEFLKDSELNGRYEITESRTADADLNADADAPTVLLIEDDLQIRNFIQEELHGRFKVVTAADGDEGLAKATTTSPDLIISDVMMPGKNGFEVTRTLKNDFNTCHIPVVLLTALQAEEKQLEGITCGADAYIAKPFSTRYLITRVERLIEQRRQLREKFVSEPTARRSSICSNDKDRLFLDKMESLLDRKLSDPAFSVDEFAQEMEMGRTLFYRKIKGITGYTPNEYIRILRMKQGAELLQTTNLTIAEVAFRVGINDPFYFSKCFKAQFGMSPSQFQKQE